MKRRKILCVWGTRPEAIKMAPVLFALRNTRDSPHSTARGKLAGKWGRSLTVVTCATAQHRGMLDQALMSFKVRPDYDLDLMRPDQTLEEITRRVVGGLRRVLKREAPDLVLVQGDTTTTLASCLAASYLGIPTGHVEAGLRTHDFSRPFPEELNRVLTDRLSVLHFAPTRTAKRNLLREGLPRRGIFVTGNTVVDALRRMEPKSRRPQRRALSRLFRDGPVLLTTLHRRESFGRPLRGVCSALMQIAERYPVRILFPVHPNPSVRKTARGCLNHPRIHLTRPLDYPDFLYAMRHSLFILTDSGGIQEEAPHFHKPVLVLREVTERPEAVRVGAAKLVGTDPVRILREAGRLLKDREALRRMSHTPNPFGDGRASERITRAVLHHFGLGPRPEDWAGKEEMH